MSEMIPLSDCYKKRSATRAEIVQDSRIEGHALSSAASKLQLPVEQPTQGGCWNPPENDT